MSLYLDTSVLVSCYLPEPQSEAVLKLLEQHSSELLVSQLAEVEFCSALAMRRRASKLTEQQEASISQLFQKHLQNGQYTKTYLTEETYQLAKQLLMSTSLKLRTLDALHLALSQQLEAELFTADIELANAAAYIKLPYHCPIVKKNKK